MIRAATKVRFLATVEARNLLRVGDRRGTVLPARLASGGRAILAELDEPTLRHLYWTPEPGGAGDLLDEAGFAALLDELAQIRRVGYAVNIEATETGVTALGVVLMSGPAEPVAAFSVSTPKDRFRRLFEGRVPELLRETRRDIEHDIVTTRLAKRPG